MSETVHAHDISETDIPSTEELVARTRELVPLLQERADEDEANRMVNRDTVRRMREAGLFRVLQSKRWGGYESGPNAFAEIQMILAEGDMSVAWIYGVIGVHTYHLCLFDDQAARDVWGEDSSALVSSPYMPFGVGKSVEGGFEFSGRWPFSSGCDHCDWTFLGGFVDGDPKDFRTFLLPRKDAKILDTWHTLGLAATGSHDVVVEKAFVPEYRTHKFIDAFTGNNPGRVVNKGPIFRIPMQQVFYRAITNGQLGALKRLIDIAKEYAPKQLFGRGAIGKHPDAQLALAEATAGLEEMKVVLFANHDTLMRYAERDETPPIELRHLIRYQNSAVADRCMRLAQPILEILGSSTVYNRSGVGQIHRNMLTGRQHVVTQYRDYGRIFGDVLFGGEPEDIML